MNTSLKNQIDNMFSPKLATVDGLDVGDFGNSLKNVKVPQTQTQINYNAIVNESKVKPDVDAGVNNKVTANRQTILDNIAESQSARNASNFRNAPNSVGVSNTTGNKIFSPVEFKGATKVGGEVRDISRKVYQRNDINWDYVNPETGLSNLDWSKLGNAPIGKDGLPIELHHLLQEEAGPMAEVNSVHGKGQKILHGLRESRQSFRNNPVLEKQYNNFGKKYWKWRANKAEK